MQNCSGAMLQRFKKILEARHSHLSFFRGKTGWLRSSSQTIYGSTCPECFADSGIAWQPRFLLNEENIRGVAATLTQARHLKQWFVHELTSVMECELSGENGPLQGRGPTGNGHGRQSQNLRP